ncbi:MAG: hypothetical protein GY864_01805 [Desulfobacterales bacterium]|nr:hypothetical protein [Desulfobacterales bacterium]
MGPHLFVLDFLTVMTAYIFLIYGRTGSGAFALGQGFMIDLFSGGLHGLFVFLYLSVWGGLCLGSLLFDLKNVKGQMFLIFLVVLLKEFMLFVMLAVFSQELVLRSFMVISGTSAIGTGLVAPILFYLFNHFGDFAFNGMHKASTD